MDAASALYKMERIVYALTFIDLVLPRGGDGNEIARRVKALPEPFCLTPLVAMTGTAAESGLFAAVMQKPFLPRDPFRL
jgi:CheY-like chemotaxis protein